MGGTSAKGVGKSINNDGRTSSMLSMNQMFGKDSISYDK